MKKVNILFVLLIGIGLFSSWSAGNFSADYTGNTGLNGTHCGSGNCHATGIQTNTVLQVDVKNSANVNIANTSVPYTIGATYDVEVKAFVGNKVRAGFQCMAWNPFTNAAAGTVLNTTMPNMVQVFTDASGRQYASHTLIGSSSSPTVISGAYAIWKYKWIAPTTNIGAVSFNCIVNITDNSNSLSGDTVYQHISWLQAPQIPTQINTEQTASNRIYPNPCTQVLHFENKIEASSIMVLNCFGQLIGNYELSDQSIRTHQLVSGYYRAVWKEGNKSYSIPFVKQ